tara:strand:- start:788 stop:1501 length:714 start_codon:yes stop_codon:yes gene_type:complete
MISIVTVVYNNRDGLKKTLKSLKKLQSDKFEHVLIDGGSKDGTLDIIKKYDFANKVFLSESDRGLYDAMNKGLSLANGDYVIFLNSGDTVTNDFFEISELLYKEKFDYYYSGVIFEGKKINYHMPKYNHGDEYLQKMPFPHPGLFVKKTIFNEIGNFDIKKKRTADHDWIVRLINSRKKGLLIRQYLIKFKLDGMSLSYLSTVEMYITARNHGRNIFYAIIYFFYGLVVVFYYKFFL